MSVSNVACTLGHGAFVFCHSHTNWLARRLSPEAFNCESVCPSVRRVRSASENVVNTYKTKTRFNSIAENRRPVQKLVRKLTYLWTNVRTSAAVCKLILANVHKLVRKLTYSSTNVRTSAAVCKLIFANVQKLVRKLTFF